MIFFLGWPPSPRGRAFSTRVPLKRYQNGPGAERASVCLRPDVMVDQARTRLLAGPAGFEPATLGSEGLHGLVDLDALSVFEVCVVYVGRRIFPQRTVQSVC